VPDQSIGNHLTEKVIKYSSRISEKLTINPGLHLIRFSLIYNGDIDYNKTTRNIIINQL
jgi:hypothetical protein